MRALLLSLALVTAARAAEVAAPAACPFDAIPKPELISRTSQFSLKPTQGMMGVEGYSLLIPREHVASFSDLAPAVHAEFRKQAAQAAAAVEAAYGAPVLFEHGVTGQSIGHAHLHIVPGVKLERLVQETERLLEGVSYSKKVIDVEDAVAETARAKAQAGGYLYLADPKAGKAVVYAVAPEPGRAMILRKAAAAALGRPQLADWRAVRADPAQAARDEELRRRTLERLSPPALAKAVLSVLAPDLLKPRWRKAGKPAPFGHCYAASEALFHMLGGKLAGWTPMRVRHEGGMHWFLRHASGAILDATAAQFRTPVPYGQAKGGGFLTRDPSRRAAEIARRVSALPAARPRSS